MNVRTPARERAPQNNALRVVLLVCAFILTLLALFQWALFALSAGHMTFLVPCLATVTASMNWLGVVLMRRR